MADAKLTALSATTTPVSTDIAYIVTDPGGTPASNKVTIGNMFAKAHGVLTTLGDSIYGAASGVLTRLAGNTTTTKKFLRQTGDGANSAAPAWDTVTAADVGLGNVTNESKATMFTSPTFSAPVLGTPASGTLTNCTGLPEGGLSLTDLTTANASATAHGFLPKWPNNTTTFLRGDGTYAAPSAAAYSRGFTKTVAASNSLDTTDADYICDGTADEAEINTAITACSAAGGGTVKLMGGTFNTSATAISMATGVSLVGQGNLTILKRTANSQSIIINGAATNNIRIADMTIDGNTGSGTYAIDLSLALSTNVTISNVSCVAIGAGMNLKVQLSKVSNCYFSESTAGGSAVAFASGSIYNTISGNVFTSTNISNSTFFNIGSGCSRSKFIGNTANGTNSTSSYFVVENSGSPLDNSYIGNHVNKFSTAFSAMVGATIVGNTITATIGTGIALTDSCVVEGNIFDGFPGSTIAISVQNSGVENVISGNSFTKGNFGSTCTYFVNLGTLATRNTIIGNSCPSDKYSSGFINLNTGFGNICKDNIGQQAIDDISIITMVNTSGSTINAGNLVTRKAAAAGNEVTTSTTGGDNTVFGMAVESIANNASGKIQVSGKTVLMTVNGTAAIAIGDFITQYTAAGIGAKAVATNTAIAVALEAYSTADSNGVIDAILITPRLI